MASIDNFKEYTQASKAGPSLVLILCTLPRSLYETLYEISEAEKISCDMSLLNDFDKWFVNHFERTWYTSKLIATPHSKNMTEIFTVLFVLVISYETLYWSGIYLGLWEYHAKEIFTEVPVHCAHVYVRVATISKENKDRLAAYYTLRKSTFGALAARKLAKEIFTSQFVRYHFEFSPEDFESVDDPDFGCSIGHFRQRLAVFLVGSVFNLLADPQDIVIMNNRLDEVTKDAEYMVRCGIETGNVIDCVVVS